MSQINGGRIVPILTGHDVLQSFDQPALLTSSISQSSISSSSTCSDSLPPSTMPKCRQDKATGKRPKAKMPDSSLEMASLMERGLYALPTEGDGNCLYYSLSDQLFGDFTHGNDIRQRVADHMSNNKEYFMQFVSQGGERRRPRRAAASAYATRSADVPSQSEQEKERLFTDMIAKSRKNGEWAGSEHIQAFCQAYRLDVGVYTSDGVRSFQDVNSGPDESRNVVHVAFHTFNHYSSVRSVDKKHEGLLVRLEHDGIPYPDVDDKAHVKSEAVTTEDKTDINTDVKTELDPHKPVNDSHNDFCSEQTAIDPNTISDNNLAVDLYGPWHINTIEEGLGGRYDRETIIDMLKKCRGDIDRAFAALLDEDADAHVDKKSAPVIPVKPSLQASRESSPFSTGSKRSADDSDDSEDPRPARRVKPKKRMISNLTLGVGISFRDDLDELVSLNLHVNPDTEQGQATDPPAAGNTSPEYSDTEEKTCRRSGRLSRPRPN